MLLTGYIDIHKTTFTATGALTAGQPVNFAGALAAADAHILGIAIEDIATADVGTNNAITAALTMGEVDVVANGVITAGDYIKVGAGGKFLSADAAALAAGKVVGTAKTAATGDGVTFTAFIGMVL